MRPPLYLAIAAVVASPGGGAIGAAGGEGGAAPVFLLPMAPLDVPIVEGARSDGRLRLKLVLRAADAADLERLRGSLPALRETTLAAASEFARLHATPFAPVNARLLARDMTKALHERDATIAAVLLVEVAAIRA